MLNLLPPEIKNQEKIHSKVSNLVLAYIFVGAVILIGTVGLFLYNLTLAASINDKKEQLTNLATEKKNVQSVADKLAFIQDRLTQANNFQEKQNLDELINTIAADTPTSVQLSNLKVAVDSVKGSTISLSGKSPSRRDIVLFQDKLATEKGLTTVALASMATAAGSDGNITFSIQMGVAK